MTNNELILANLMRAMIKYDGGDTPRIQHFVKVHDFARMIAIAEGMTGEELFVLEAAAILHDVGIHHHHTYQDVTSLDHRILLEADFLVNSFEDHLALEGIITFRNHVFRSESAIRMLNDMWGL